MTILPVTTHEEFAALGRLIKEYQADLGINLSFQNFDEELAHLDTIYGPPTGRAFIAYNDSEEVGSVAVRQFESHIVIIPLKARSTWCLIYGLWSSSLPESSGLFGQ